MEAILCNKDNKALDVTLENGVVTKIGYVYDKNNLPLCLQTELTLDTINRWLDKRRMPAEREGLEDAKRIFGAEHFQSFDNMFSLTDQYWFKTSKRDNWKKLNFFTNRYSSAIGQTLFTPWDIDEEELNSETPDLTTNGVLRKVWVQDEETLVSYLIKAGSKRYYQQPLSEVLATLTLRKLDKFIPYVRYDLCVNGLRICSKCRNFVNEHTEFIPAQSIYNLHPRSVHKSQYEHFLLQCYLYGVEKPDDFTDKMLFVDAIIGNTDRHMGNFGFLRDVDTNTLVGFAPLFDFGSAFREYYPNRTEKARLFGEQLPRIYQKFGNLPVLQELKNTDDLFRIIDMYPDLTANEKKSIKEGIEKRVKFFTNTDNLMTLAR